MPRATSPGGAAGGGGNIPGPVIGSHQGFKIRVNATDGTVNFTNAMRTARQPGHAVPAGR
jgi:hypothetical protein